MIVMVCLAAIGTLNYSTLHTQGAICRRCAGDKMTEWVPTLPQDGSPRYAAFVAALEADIVSGQVKPGMRLLPQREMAQRLSLSVGTISKAYAEAELRGLISGEVGRGTF